MTQPIDFKHWLNERRMLDVSMVFHDIVELYNNSIEAAKQEGRRQGLEEARGLRADALEIFNGPECPQIVRDAIEWYAASVECLIEKEKP